MKNESWKKCRNPKDWICDECRMCTDPQCKNCGSDPRPRWMKHFGEDIALCEKCWDKHHEKYQENQ